MFISRTKFPSARNLISILLLRQARKAGWEEKGVALYQMRLQYSNNYQIGTLFSIHDYLKTTLWP